MTLYTLQRGLTLITPSTPEYVCGYVTLLSKYLYTADPLRCLVLQLNILHNPFASTIDLQVAVRMGTFNPRLTFKKSVGTHPSPNKTA